MLTHSASVSASRWESRQSRRQCVMPDRGAWTHRRQAEVRQHLMVLEQATVAVFEGYLSHPLSDRAAHAAQQLLALAETLGWREGTRIAQVMASLFPIDTTLGLVHALHLSELLVAFYREMAQEMPDAQRLRHQTGDVARATSRGERHATVA